MNVTVDGLSVSGVDSMAPAEIVEYLQTQLGEQNRTVRSVWINGQYIDTPWPELCNVDQLGMPITEISLSSSTVLELLRDVTSDTIETSSSLQASVKEVAYHFQCGKDELAFAAYSEMIEFFQSLSTVLHGLANYQMFSVDWNAELAVHLDKIVKAWVRNDFVEMTDLLLYILLPALEAMSLDLSELHQEIEVQI